MSIERLKFRGKVARPFQYLDDNNNLVDVRVGEWFFGDSIDRLELLWRGVVEGYIDPATVGQWTGLKDKKGVDVYEEDILLKNPDDAVGEQVRVTVEWCCDDYSQFIGGCEEDDWNTDTLDSVECKRSIVIGTIHDEVQP